MANYISIDTPVCDYWRAFYVDRRGHLVRDVFFARDIEQVHELFALRHPDLKLRSVAPMSDAELRQWLREVESSREG